MVLALFVVDLKNTFDSNESDATQECALEVRLHRAEHELAHDGGDGG